MPKHIPPKIPSKPPAPNTARGILELERFSEESLTQWHAAAQNLDELEDVLYFNLEPERRKLRNDLIEALKVNKFKELHLNGWLRIVDYQFSLEPLSCSGSLRSYGGRFNAGMELDSGNLKPWPALYIAENLETAFREKFHIKSSDLIDGLTPNELALQPGNSHSNVSLEGKLFRVFDMTSDQPLIPIAQILKRIKLPAKAKELQKRLKIPASKLFMITTSKQVYDMALNSNWRTLPVQFGLPAKSHILAELIRAAGFEAILYKSTQGPGKCLAVFPDLLDERSYIEIIGEAPRELKHRRLDSNSSKDLDGWNF